MSSKTALLPALLATALLVGLGCAPKANPATPTDVVQEVRLFARDNEFAPAQFKVKALRQVRLIVNSWDREYVIHAPDLGISPTRVPANQNTVVMFTPTTLGSYSLENPEIRDMKTTVVVQACAPEAEVENPVAVTTDSLAAGESLYAELCVSCHGSDGRGDGPEIQSTGLKPADFTQSFMGNISDGELFWIISNGWQGMPSFTDRLSEKDRWHVVNYLRTLSNP